MTTNYVPLDITPLWARVNDELIELLDLVPDDQLNWSTKPARVLREQVGA